MTTAARAGGLARDTGLFSDQFLANPLPALAQLCRAGRPVFLAQPDLRAVVKHHMVHAVQHDHERFSSAAAGEPQLRFSKSLSGLAALAVRAGPVP